MSSVMFVSWYEVYFRQVPLDESTAKHNCNVRIIGGKSIVHIDLWQATTD